MDAALCYEEEFYTEVCRVMGFMNSLRNLMGVTEEEPEVVEEAEENTVNVAPQINVRDTREEERRARIANFPSQTSKAKVVLVKPDRFEDASAIADHLNAKHTVVLNLESADREVSRRLVDFLSGVAYANKGTLKRVAKATFLITPANIDMSGELVDEVESSELY